MVKTKGPATVISSVRTPVAGAELAMFKYVIPLKFSGTAQPPLVNGTKMVPPGAPPLVKAQKLAPDADVLSCKVTPMATAFAAGEDMVMGGNGVMARFEPVGQESMKPAARVKTLRIPRGVSNALGTATA